MPPRAIILIINLSPKSNHKPNEYEHYSGENKLLKEQNLKFILKED